MTISRDEALTYLYSRVDYERVTHFPYSDSTLRLSRMRELLARLGDPHLRFPAVHVSGTKGKGSTSAMTAAVLSAAGYRTGLFTSPHLERLEERLVIDGRECTGPELAALVERVRPAVAEMDAEREEPDGTSRRPTFFEIITAMAMLYFVEHNVQAAVLEVGLGGRLDSTNVCRPLVSVITSISFDHLQQLGNTLALIAREKAGIIKPGVPVVCGVTEPEPLDVIADVCKQLGSRRIQTGRDFDFDYQPPDSIAAALAGSTATVRCQTAAGPRIWSDLKLKLLGRHQAANAALVLAACVELEQQGWTIPEAAIRRGLAEVSWPARVEIIAQRPLVILDSAHNQASVRALLSTLDEVFPAEKAEDKSPSRQRMADTKSPSQQRMADTKSQTARKKILVFAASRDKDLSGMLSLLLPRFDHVILTRYVSNPRGVPIEELAALASAIGRFPLTLCPDLSRVSSQVAALAGPDDLVCITGSLFIAAELRPQFARPQ